MTSQAFSFHSYHLPSTNPIRQNLPHHLQKDIRSRSFSTPFIVPRQLCNAPKSVATTTVAVPKTKKGRRGRTAIVVTAALLEYLNGSAL